MPSPTSLNSSMNPDVVKAGLDDVFVQEFEVGRGPGVATAETEAIFHQTTATTSAIIEEVFKGTGLWGKKAEEQDVPQSAARVADKITFTVVDFDQSVDIPKRFFDDNMHSTYEKMIKDMAESGRVTKEMNAFEVFRNAFTTSLTADGVTLVSDSHVTIGGYTVDNKMTAALDDTSLDDAIVMLGEQKAQDGTIRGMQPAALLVPMKLYKKACEITKSQLRSGTSNNDTNVFSTAYAIEVYTSPYLGTAAGGSNTAWFLLARNHSIFRWVRQSVQTVLVDWRTQRNNNYIYKGEFREMVGAIDYAGIVGSTGVA